MLQGNKMSTNNLLSLAGNPGSGSNEASKPSCPVSFLSLNKRFNNLPTVFSNHQLADKLLENEHENVNGSVYKLDDDYLSFQQQQKEKSNNEAANTAGKTISPKKSHFSLKKILSFSSSTESSFIKLPFLSFESKCLCKSSTNKAVCNCKKSSHDSLNLLTKESSPAAAGAASSSKRVDKSVKKKLINQPMSLNSAFNSISQKNYTMSPSAAVAYTNLGGELHYDAATHNLDNKIVLVSEFEDKMTSTTTTTSTTTICSSEKASLFVNSGLLFNRYLNMQPKKNYKEKIKSLNVRRKSSLLINEKSILAECSNSTAQFYKALSEQANEASAMQHRGSNTSIGMLMGVNDLKLRKKLLRLQKQQNDFIFASSKFLSTGQERRKKAFAAMVDIHNKPEDTDSCDDYDNHRRLSHIISSLVSSLNLQSLSVGWLVGWLAGWLVATAVRDHFS